MKIQFVSVNANYLEMFSIFYLSSNFKFLPFVSLGWGYSAFEKRSSELFQETCPTQCTLHRLMNAFFYYNLNILFRSWKMPNIRPIFDFTWSGFLRSKVFGLVNVNVILNSTVRVRTRRPSGYEACRQKKVIIANSSHFWAIIFLF